MSPRGFIAAIQRLRACCGSRCGVNQVALAPAASAVSGRGVAPSVIAMAQPPAVAVLAAISLVFMPPLDRPETPSPAIASISGVILSIDLKAMRGRVDVRVANRRTRPRRDSSTSWSAPTVTAICAASRSLSPKRISSVATVSFSLTIGTMPKRQHLFQARRGR